MKTLLLSLMALLATLRLHAQAPEPVGYGPVDDYVASAHAYDAKVKKLAADVASLDAEIQELELKVKLKLENPSLADAEGADKDYKQAKAFDDRAVALGEQYENLKAEGEALALQGKEAVEKAKDMPNKTKIPKAQKNAKDATDLVQKNKSRLDEDTQAYKAMRQRAEKVSAMTAEDVTGK